MCSTSRTERLDPNSEQPNTDSDDPILAKERQLIEDPKWTKSKMEKEEPNLANPKTE
jgi:hypothetical protein